MQNDGKKKVKINVPGKMEILSREFLGSALEFLSKSDSLNS